MCISGETEGFSFATFRTQGRSPNSSTQKDSLVHIRVVGIQKYNYGCSDTCKLAKPPVLNMENMGPISPISHRDSARLK